MRMRVLYPDLVLASPDAEKAVLITHGQYIESASKVMSGFLRMIAPQIPEPPTSRPWRRRTGRGSTSSSRR